MSLSEDFLEDRFPRQPLTPGVLVIGGLARLSGLPPEATMRAGGVRFKALTGLAERTRLRRPLGPGDRLVHRRRMTRYDALGGRELLHPQPPGPGLPPVAR